MGDEKPVAMTMGAKVLVEGYACIHIEASAMNKLKASLLSTGSR